MDKPNKPVASKPKVIEAEVIHKRTTPQASSDSDILAEAANFPDKKIERPYATTVKRWRAGLRATEIDDHRQKLRARPIIAWGVGALLLVQNVAIWYLVKWALWGHELGALQLIFSTLIAGTLTQSYFLLRLIVRQIFGKIDYHNEDDKNGKS
jgi:hypothetical protein